MENQPDIQKLFFELASESRISILRKLNDKRWKMNDLARKLDLTTTETFRQLQRLSEALFVSKDSDGYYNLTPFGKLVLFLSPSFEFVLKHSKYFLEHDVWSLPSEFILRIGELNNGILKSNISEVVEETANIIKNAEEHVWTMTNQVLAPHGNAVKEKLSSGIMFRSLHPKDMLAVEMDYSEFGDCVQRRYLQETPVIMVITEKRAIICFPFIGGNPDIAAFISEDPTFKKWTTDLYQHYWEQAKTITKSPKPK